MAHPAVGSVSTLTRRPSPHTVHDPAAKLRPSVNPNTDSWASELPSLVQPSAASPSAATAVFSALGTTRSAAGSLEAQRKIDYDLNYALACAAKKAGVRTYVLVSTTGANPHSWMAYSQMKGQLEADVMALGFDRCVVLRPGLLLGQRDKPRLVERPLQALVGLVGAVSTALRDSLAQDAATVARAGVRAALDDGVWAGRKTVAGKNGGTVWTMGMAEIVELGKLPASP